MTELVSLKKNTKIYKTLQRVKERKIRSRAEAKQWWELTDGGSICELLYRGYIREDEDDILHFVSWRGLRHRDCPDIKRGMMQVKAEMVIRNRLKYGTATTSELRGLCKVSRGSLDRYLNSLRQRGLVHSVERGVWKGTK